MPQRVQSRRVRLTTGGQPDEVGSVVQRGGSTCFPGAHPGNAQPSTIKHNHHIQHIPIDLTRTHNSIRLPGLFLGLKAHLETAVEMRQIQLKLRGK